MKIVKVKDLKSGDLIRSIKDPTLPTILVISGNHYGKHIIHDGFKDILHDHHFLWNEDVELVSENNSVKKYEHLCI